MDKKEQRKLIEDWMTKNQLIYEVNPQNSSEVRTYIEALEPKLPELYKLLVDNKVIEENTFNSFVSMIESTLNGSRHNAVFRGM